MNHENGSSPGAMTRREDFGGTELAERAETATAAQSQAMTAMVQARFVLAAKRPRVIDDVRVALLNECKRPRFADTARYSVPRGGKKIEGPSIRFVETATRLMGNLCPTTTTVYDDDEKRIVRCEVLDLETNTSWSKDITVTKTVERKSSKGYRIIGTRTNGYGEEVFIVEATDDDFAVKEGAAISKTQRTLALRLIPADIVEEAMDQCIATQRDRDAKDPTEARKKLVEFFANLGVRAADLVDYFGGRQLDSLTPVEFAELRAIGGTLRDRQASWRDILDASPHRTDASSPNGTDETSATAATRKKVEERMKANAPKPPAGPPPAKGATAPPAKPPSGPGASQSAKSDEDRARAIDSGDDDPEKYER